jgi:hypothetical protein
MVRKLRLELRNHTENTRPTMPVPPIADEEQIDSSGIYDAIFTEADVHQRLGSFDRIPLVRLSAEEICKLPLDPASAFLVGSMDGMLTIEMLLDMAAMPRSVVLRSLCLLVDHGVVTLH